MTRVKYLVAVSGIAAAAFVLQGCAKKKDSAEDMEFAALTKTAVPSQSKATDIFDEFYMDEESKAAAETRKAAAAAPTTAAAAKTAAPAPAAAKTAAPAPAAAKTAAPAPAAKAAPAASARSQPPPPAARGRGGSYSFAPGGRYVVQVNSTAMQGGAQKIANKLKDLGYPAYVVEVQNPTPDLIGTYYRVRIGSFDGYSEAKNFAEAALVPAGYEYWVDRKSNDNVGIQGGGFGSGAHQQYQQKAPAPAPAPAPVAVPAAPPPPPAPAPVAAPPPPPVPAPVAAPPPAPAPAPSAKPAQAPPPAPAPAPAPSAKPAQAPPPAAAPAGTPAAPASEWGSDDWGTEW